ncbi:hypothetical protein D8674_035419 [Pyrus ussuriensis x Pyrus communis]|uniref:DNA N(6)-methyladenine demethylase n=1 Tax=Pyrus ussuriensis x Pyrus communis TaxID=2448454 RepID=A0A5N5GD79_9ROSA|nr:uncharacterized protein LOC103929274 isoform X1 [Pyrus x bretschneideri]KAB2613103.1 hypothetical protein D8674_035419 [Pyrus ussuriensis x Pyrus communis]
MDNRAQDGDISRGGRFSTKRGGQARECLRGGRFSTNRGGQARESLRGGRFPTNRGGQARGNQRGGRHSPLAAGHPSNLHSPQAGPGTHGTFSNDSSGNNEFLVSYHSEHKPATSSAHRQEWHSSGREDMHSHAESLKEGHKSTDSRGVNPKVSKWSAVSDASYREHPPSFSNLSHSENLHAGVERMQIRETPSEMTEDSVTLPCKSEAHGVPFPINSPVNATNQGKPEPSEQSIFDLCPPKSRGSITLKAPLLVQNRERRNEIKRSKEQNSGIVLQSGMVLLKSYLSLHDQMNIVKLCRDLGLGSGGFYRPGYRDGAKLNLMMMCLGKNWDPETGQYGDRRPVDGAIPPKIPDEFFQLVENAIKESQSLIMKDSKTSNSKGILPWMIPDICLVNFYSSSGRLGLHQDRDESEQSLCKCLPVVSFSIGDTAEFLYGEQRDVDRANKVILESGDVLIFGGKSRHVFHGVSSIKPDTAPKTLLEKTNLRAGRLNLTFREY